MAPLIQNLEKFSLPADTNKILQLMFADYRRVMIKSEFKRGFSPSRVLLVSPIKPGSDPDLSEVVKIAPVSLIAQEWQAYQTCIQDKLPDIARVKDQPVLPSNTGWGGLRYDLVGGDTFEIESLSDYYQHAGGEDLQFVLSGRLFQSMEQRRQFSAPTPNFLFQPSYDFLLPVNLLIEPQPLPEGVEPYLLNPNTYAGQRLAPGNYAQLEDFKVKEVDVENRAVTIDLDPPFAYRLRLQAVETIALYQVNQPIPPTQGMVIETRHTLLQKQIEQTLGQDFDPTVEVVTMTNGSTLPNPLEALPAVLSKSFHVRVACIHGDLNLENILIDPAIRNVHLIDFANARRDHLLHDALRLETSVLTRLIPSALARANLPGDTVCSLFQQLHLIMFTPDQTITLPDPSLEKAFTLLLAIRRWAYKCLFEQNNWAEYYHGLFLYLMGALKYKNLDDEAEAPLPKQVAFWGAAAACDLIANPPPPPPRRDWDRMRPYLPVDMFQKIQEVEQIEQEKICIEQLNYLLYTVVAYLPRHLALALLKDPQVANNQGSFLDGTLLFADISGFTALSEKLRKKGGKEGAEEMVRIINEYLDVMLDILFKYNGLLIKFGGDAMLGLFMGDDQGAMAAVWAAWEMKQAMSEHFAEIEVLQEAVPLNMKVGHNSGALFAASVGTEEHMEYILTGSAVERTAQAESAAYQGDILISSETWALVKDHLSAEELTDKPGFYRVVDLHTKPALIVAGTWREIEESLSGVAYNAWAIVDRLEALTPYLPAGVLPQLVYDPQQGKIEGQHRQVTILFANFTGMSEVIHARGHDDPDGIAADLSEYFQAMQEEVLYYGGVINKVDLYDQGDKLMVIFGAPQAHERDTRRAALTALAMQEAMRRLSSPTASVLLSQRIGIHTGYVFAGNVGSFESKRCEYTVIGDAVNLAARLMSAAPPGEVWISQRAWNKIQTDFEAKALPAIQAKGISELIRPFQLLKTDGVQKEQTRSRILHSDIVGRDVELRALEKYFDDLMAGWGKQVIAVTGEGGVGKTRLITEWQQKSHTFLQEGETVIWLSGRGHSYGQKTQGVFIEILEQLLDFSDEDDQDERWNKLSNQVKETFANPEAGWFNEFLTMLAYLGQFLALDLSMKQGLTERVEQLKAETLRLETRLALCKLLAHTAKKKSLILLLEDLHWADDASLDMLAFILDRVSDDAPVLFCLIHRPQKEKRIWQIWQDIKRSHPDCHAISLDELKDEQSAQLLFNLLQNDQLAEDFRMLVAHETDGNPLYIEEVLHTLIEDGAITKEDGAWQVSRGVERIHVPDTLYQIIQSRIDELDFGSPGARRLLWMAAVIGETFSEDLLLHLFTGMGREKTEFLAHLRELRNAAMIERTRIESSGRSQRGYRFRHGLLRQVTYENMLHTKRREFHRQVGYWLEEKYQAELRRYYDLLAYHFDQGRDWQKASRYHLLAGAEALKRYAASEAIEHYISALTILDILPDEHRQRRISGYEGLGDAYNILGDFDSALRNYQNAFKRLNAGQLTDTEQYRAADIARRIGRLLGWQANYTESLAWMEKGQSYLGEPLSDESLPVAAMLNIHTGSLYYLMGQYDQAADHCRRGLDILTGTQNLAELAEGHNLLGVVNYTYGAMSKAMKYYEQSIAYWDQVGDTYHRTRVVENLGTLYFYLGDLERARVTYEQGLAFWEKVGHKYQIAHAWQNLGGVYLQQGLWTKANQFYEAALADWQEDDDLRWFGQSHTNLGSLRVEQKDWDSAGHHLKLSQDILQANNIQDILAETYRWLGELACGLGQTEIALTHAREGLALAEALKIKREIGANHRVMGKAYALTGEGEQAESHLRKSLSTFESLGYRYELGRTHFELANLFKAENKQTDFESHRAIAIDVFSALGAQKDLEKTKALG